MKILLPIIVLLISFHCVLGCSYIAYPVPPVDYIASKTGTIFIGRVISKSSTIQTEDDYKYRLYRIKFKVEKVLKGVDNEIQEITFQKSITNRTSCSVDPPKFKKGDLWVIHKNFDSSSSIERFVYGPGFDDIFQYLPKYHEEYIVNLEKAIKNPITAIYGAAHTFRSWSFLNDVEVSAEANGIKLTTKTNKDGEYSFKNIPAGNYKIKIRAPLNIKDYFNNKNPVFDVQTQTYYYEYEISLKKGDSDFYFIVINEWR